PTVAAQAADEASLYHEVKKLIAFRQAHAALRNDGEIEFLETENYPLVFARKAADEKLLVVINPSDRVQPLGGGIKPGEALYTIGGKIEGAAGGFAAPPCSAGVYLL
ncbi:MAG: glycosylase, partial [Ruminococcus flavefaciens]|nr:glycosylase [Ruminococcus flavefaciens]